MMTKDKVYSLVAESAKPDPQAELEGIANSLTFQMPLVFPDPNRPKGDERFSYKVGELVGGLLAVVVLVSIVSRVIFKKKI